MKIARWELIAAVAAGVVWPLAAHAKQTERVRRIGVLMLYPESDTAGQARVEVFRQTLEKLGWSIVQDLRIDIHWGSGDAVWMRGAVTELLTQVPDLILANSSEAIKPVQQANSRASGY